MPFARLDQVFRRSSDRASFAESDFDGLDSLTRDHHFSHVTRSLSLTHLAPSYHQFVQTPFVIANPKIPALSPQLHFSPSHRHGIYLGEQFLGLHRHLRGQGCIAVFAYQQNLEAITIRA